MVLDADFKNRWFFYSLIRMKNSKDLGKDSKKKVFLASLLYKFGFGQTLNG